jgi:hypothetical protein
VLFYQETTLEAVIEEQEMRAQSPSNSAASAAAADEIRKSAEVEAATMLKQPNGFHRSNTNDSYTVNEAANPASGEQPVAVHKTRKETRQETNIRRIDALKRAESNLKMNGRPGSATSTPNEHAKNDGEGVERNNRSSIGDNSKSKDKEGSLSRFRHGNMSLRGTTRLFSSGSMKIKANKGEEKLKEKGSSSQLQISVKSDVVPLAPRELETGDSTSTIHKDENSTRAMSTKTDATSLPSALSSPPLHAADPPYAVSNASSLTPPPTSHGATSDAAHQIPRKPVRRTPFASFGHFGRSDKAKEKDKHFFLTSPLSKSEHNQPHQPNTTSTTINGGPVSTASTTSVSTNANEPTVPASQLPPPSSSSTSSSLPTSALPSAVQNNHITLPPQQLWGQTTHPPEKESSPTALPTFNISSPTSALLPGGPVENPHLATAEGKPMKKHRFSLGGKKKSSTVT